MQDGKKNLKSRKETKYDRRYPRVFYSDPARPPLWIFTHVYVANVTHYDLTVSLA